MYNVRTWIGGVIYKNSDPLCVLVLGKIKWGKKLLSSTNICLREEKDLYGLPKYTQQLSSSQRASPSISYRAKLG